MRNLLKTILRVVGVLVILGVGIFICISVIGTVISFNSADWIEVPTQITYTYSLKAHNTSWRVYDFEYFPQPKYTFIVNGREYKGSVYSIPESPLKYPDITDKMLKEQPIVIEGTIFYNSNNPNQSAVKRPDLDGWLNLLFLIPGIFLIVGGLYFIDEEVVKKAKMKKWPFIKSIINSK